MKYVISNCYNKTDEFFMAEYQDPKYLDFLRKQGLKYKPIPKNVFRFIKNNFNTFTEGTDICEVGIKRKVHVIKS